VATEVDLQISRIIASIVVGDRFNRVGHWPFVLDRLLIKFVKNLPYRCEGSGTVVVTGAISSGTGSTTPFRPQVLSDKKLRSITVGARHGMLNGAPSFGQELHTVGTALAAISCGRARATRDPSASSSRERGRHCVLRIRLKCKMPCRSTPSKGGSRFAVKKRFFLWRVSAKKWRSRLTP
jgi:hypothetical protein